jgi:hypothetical protein
MPRAVTVPPPSAVTFEPVMETEVLSGDPAVPVVMVALTALMVSVPFA